MKAAGIGAANEGLSYSSKSRKGNIALHVYNGEQNKDDWRTTLLRGNMSKLDQV
jgi:hypothetical protein